MVGSGNNKKSMAYVENIAAFLKFATKIESGHHILIILINLILL